MEDINLETDQNLEEFGFNQIKFKEMRKKLNLLS